MKKLAFVFLLSSIAALSAAPAAKEPQPSDPRLKRGFKLAEKNGWVVVHLQGSPAEIGYQHGYLLAAGIVEMQKVNERELTHDSSRDYAWYRHAAETVFWPKVEAEYRAEIEGIVEGAKAHGAGIDLWDVVLLNLMEEISPYYTKWCDRNQKSQAFLARPAPVERKLPGEHCSGFVATGSYTRDGRPVIAHNNWTGYMEGARWNILFDIVPQSGNRIFMDGVPGLIHSADDFGMNSAGIMITETTISAFDGFNPDGIPEFVRARKAMQYANSIDEFARIMKEGNNGGYANNWLVADRKTGEIADLELGLRNVNLRRTRDGFFVGTNFPVNDKLLAEETTFKRDDMSHSANARRARAEDLVKKAKGTIDLAFAHRYLTDHYDSYDKKVQPNERTLCGHIDLSPRGVAGWVAPYGAAGTVQNKAATAEMAERMTLSAAMGHACGLSFKARKHVAAHPDLAWQKDLLRDLDSHTFSTFTAPRQ
jgi:hypothetical protein